MVSDTLERRIIKMSGNSVTLSVYVQEGEKTHTYEVTLPIKKELLDTAVSNIGRKVRFCTWKGFIESLEPAW